MVLTGSSIGGLFPHNRTFGEGVAERGNRAGGATIVVSVDGTGDAEAIQEAVNMLPSGGGVIYIKEGTYNVSTQIDIQKSNVTIVGAGKSTVINVTGSNYAFDIDDVEGVTIEKLYFTGSSGAGIYCSGTSFCFFYNCWFDTLAGSGIVFAIQATNNIIRGCVFDTTGAGQIQIVGSNNIIEGNIFINGTAQGIELIGTSECIVANNQVRGNSTVGIDLTSVGARNVIVGNYVELNGTYGIQIATNHDRTMCCGNITLSNTTANINDLGTNTHPNGASGTTNLAFDDLNIIA